MKANKEIYINKIDRIVKRYYAVTFNDVSTTYFATLQQAKDFVKWANKHKVSEIDVLDSVDFYQRENDLDYYKLLEHKEIFEKKQKKAQGVD